MAVQIRSLSNWQESQKLTNSTAWLTTETEQSACQNSRRKARQARDFPRLATSQRRGGSIATRPTINVQQGGRQSEAGTCRQEGGTPNNVPAKDGTGDAGKPKKFESADKQDRELEDESETH